MAGRIQGGSDSSVRFEGLVRLYGVAGVERLRAARVGVIGIGGVGSWAVEALARSGVGAIDMVDLDSVCLSNVNRQLHALTTTVGQPKIEVMAERVRAIHPDCSIQTHSVFFTEATAVELLSLPFDFVLDAIDNRRHKCLLIALCKQQQTPLITVGGAGGRRDPTCIKLADLNRTRDDPLLQQVRKKLRAEYGFTRNKKRKFGIPCVYSQELPVYPQPDGSVCGTKAASSEGSLRLDCEQGYGSASFVTGAFGFAASAYIVEQIAKPF